MVDETIVRTVQQCLRNLKEEGIPVGYAVVFGSQVSGSSNAWSDIDLLVISPKFDKGPKREDLNLLWRIAARTDSRIEPIPVGLRQFDEDDASAIIEIARRKGQVIPLAE